MEKLKQVYQKDRPSENKKGEEKAGRGETDCLRLNKFGVEFKVEESLRTRTSLRNFISK